LARKVIKYNNEFESGIYKLFNLHEIENNICEGVVIKPIVDLKMGESRVILKSKNEKFMEKAKAPKQKVKKELSDDDKNFLEEVFKYITENRLNNVLSKMCELTEKDFGKLLKEFQKDIEDEFVKDFGLEVWNEYMSKKYVGKFFSKECANFIRPYFIKNI